MFAALSEDALSGLFESVRARVFCLFSAQKSSDMF